jgi:glucosylceramidase
VYSYCDQKDDLDLETFSIDVDKTSLTGDKLANTKRILDIVKDSGKNLTLFASPWAPPGWMTNTGEVIHNPRLSTDQKIKESYANYLKKFFEEYEKEGIHFWGMTGQNEPDGNLGQWQSLRFSPEQYRDFVKDFLGPVLKARFPDLKIMMHDDQR